ncbi:hypothetical protein KQX54_006696 [Cotesia glomerata]|uniref:Uncharacterized protein n=1 Tax=Cotesia glomerata TaxID=32391 RepID=A0AAV7ITP2_COTGL|nr:hypothetical protein KQX54_006696 [Cotesia glomerata]
MEPDDYPLRVGDTFASNTDLQTYMTKVIDDTGELFTKLRSDKLYPSHFKNASLSESEIDNVIKKLEYLRITYKCKYGASTQKSKQNVVQKKRNTRFREIGELKGWNGIQRSTCGSGISQLDESMDSSP